MMKLYAGLDVSDRLTHICIADAEGRPSADYGGDYDDSAPISRTDKNPVLQGRNLVQAGRWPLPLPPSTFGTSPRLRSPSPMRAWTMFATFRAREGGRP